MSKKEFMIFLRSYWLGLRALCSSCSFEWVDGQAFAFEDWQDGEPTNNGLEHCVEYHTFPTIRDNKDDFFGKYGGLYVRFESVNYPNYFIRHRNYECWLDEFGTNGGQDLFNADSAFKAEFKIVCRMVPKLGTHQFDLFSTLTIFRSSTFSVLRPIRNPDLTKCRSTEVVVTYLKIRKTFFGEKKLKQK